MNIFFLKILDITLFTSYTLPMDDKLDNYTNNISASAKRAKFSPTWKAYHPTSLSGRISSEVNMSKEVKLRNCETCIDKKNCPAKKHYEKKTNCLQWWPANEKQPVIK